MQQNQDILVTQQLSGNHAFNSSVSYRPANVNHQLLVFSFEYLVHPEGLMNFEGMIYENFINVVHLFKCRMYTGSPWILT